MHPVAHVQSDLWLLGKVQIHFVHCKLARLKLAKKFKCKPYLCISVWINASSRAVVVLPIPSWDRGPLHTSWCLCKWQPSLRQTAALVHPAPLFSSWRCSPLSSVLVVAVMFQLHHCSPSHSLLQCPSGLRILGCNNNIPQSIKPYVHKLLTCQPMQTICLVWRQDECQDWLHRHAPPSFHNQLNPMCTHMQLPMKHNHLECGQLH